MMIVRHGFMIVGEHLCGKTMAYKVLAEALEDLEIAGEEDQFKVCYLCPVSVTVRYPISVRILYLCD